MITCAGNDFGYESVFERQVEAFGKPGDVLIILTTSGNSVNLVKAAKLAKTQKLITASFLGKGGGKVKMIGFDAGEAAVWNPSLSAAVTATRSVWSTSLGAAV